MKKTKKGATLADPKARASVSRLDPAGDSPSRDPSTWLPGDLVMYDVRHLDDISDPRLVERGFTSIDWSTGRRIPRMSLGLVVSNDGTYVGTMWPRDMQPSGSRSDLTVYEIETFNTSVMYRIA